MAQIMETTHVGIDKIKHYGWEVRDRKGEFVYVDKQRLHIDHDSYQRDPRNTDTILAMARDWSWIACGALSVADRGPPGLWVMDGQARWLAASRRSDIRDLPCMVFQVKHIKQEAEGFLSVNTLRKPVSVLGKFKAMVTAENEEAQFVNALLESTGRTVRKENRGVNGLGLMLRLAKDQRDVLIRLWPLLDEVHGERCVLEMLIQAFVYIETHMPEGATIASGRWAKRLREVPLDELVGAARKASAYYGKGGARVYADGILSRINKGLGNKLELAQ